MTIKDFNDFFTISHGKCGIVLILFLSVLVAVAQLLPTFWLSEWTSKPLAEQQRKIYPVVFISLVLLYSLLTFARALFSFKVILESITTLLNRISERVLRSKIVFFDSNPIGRILTRFTKDAVIFDMNMPI